MPNTREKLIKLLYNFYLDYNGYICDGCGTRVADQECATIADHLIANGVTVNEWISVKDRLPEYENQVLTYRGESGISVERMFPGAMWDFDYDIIDAVTHWMPLPEAPKE